MNQAATSSSSSATADIKDLIIDLAKTKGNGLLNRDIETALPDTSKIVLTKVINELLANGTLELFQDGSKIVYKYKDPANKSEIKGSDHEERIVYKIIEEAGNKGIWIREIRIKSNLNTTQLKKVLKSLETKKYIKAVYSVAASKKKVYILYNLEPDSSITGGAWYQDQDFDSEFVDILNQQCCRYLQEKRDAAVAMGGGPIVIRNRSCASASDVHQFICDLGISNVPLTISCIEDILYTVILDNKAEKIVNANGDYLYRAIKPFLSPPGIVRTTCGICPIEARCASTGFVNPKSCKYLSEWLNE